MQSPADPRVALARRETVLVLAEDASQRETLAAAVQAGGWNGVVASSEEEAVRRLRAAPPDLVVLGVSAPRQELGFLDRLRAHPEGDKVPVVVALDDLDEELTLEAFGRRADDVLTTDVSQEQLVARLSVRLERRPLPRSELQHDPVTGALTAEALAIQIELELERASRGGNPGALAYLALDALPGIEARLGTRARDEVLAQVVRLVEADGRRLDYVGYRDGLLVLLLPGTPPKGAQTRLERLSKLIYAHEFWVGDVRVAMTPIVGYAQVEPGMIREELEERAWTAMTHGAEQLDLYPTRWTPEMVEPAAEDGARTRLRRLRTPLQVVFQQLLCLGVPFGMYFALDALGLDVTGAVYLVLVFALTTTAALIWAECLAARRQPEPPPLPDRPLPCATAVIAAYLPNEAATVVETVEAFLDHDYPDLQVILAYNSPRAMPVELELREIAERDPRFELLRVEGSVSKAQNVNAALAHARGEFVGLFDADHHPRAGTFQRAWSWLANGADVVQGHCVVRNGSRNLLTRLVAAEFEVIYALSHPGRARLHGFGIFGGSNGYWRKEVLLRTRLRSFMLTEDIDSSLRVVQEGGTIVSDPGLVSTELAPDRARALWHQRLRWAQGWSQVSLSHLTRTISRPLGMRRRLGAAHLLGWRELYPWLSLQMLPLLAYWLQRGEPPVEWFIPVFVVTTLFTFSAGPAQAFLAWRLADPEVRRHGSWFLLYAVASLTFYTEFKNVIARTAQIKEAMRERKWRVTPRAHPGG